MRHLNRYTYFRRKIERVKTCGSHTVPPKTSSYFSFYSYVCIESRMKEKEQKKKKGQIKDIGTQLKSRKLPTDFDIFSLWLFKFNHFKGIVLLYKPKDKITVKHFRTSFIFLSKEWMIMHLLRKHNLIVKAILKRE